MHGTRANSSVVRRWGDFLAIAVLLLAWPSAWRLAAAEGQSKPNQEPEAASQTEGARRSLDDELLEDLDNELLEGVGDLKDRPGKSEPRATSPEAKPSEQPLDAQEVDMAGTDDDPLGYISQEMRMAERLIPQQGKRTHAEQLQRRIVEDLARLIDDAERQRAQQQSSKSKQGRQTARRESVKQPKSSTGRSAGQNSNQPAADSTDRLGQAEQAKPDPELFKGLLKDTWGNLPEHEREQMMQMSPEQFLPQYELLIERYYRRLAEERTK
ncbi:MAG: hypothetical protein WD063_18205 [Pirellulales bacterium]